MRKHHQVREGQIVRVIDGPLTGFRGEVKEVDEQTAKVAVQVFGRVTPMDLALGQIELVPENSMRHYPAGGVSSWRRNEALAPMLAEASSWRRLFRLDVSRLDDQELRPQSAYSLVPARYSNDLHHSSSESSRCIDA
jgi:KOW motif